MSFRLRLHPFFITSVFAALILSGCSTTPVSTKPQSKPQATTKTPAGYPALPAAGSGRGGYYLDDGPGDNIPEGLLDTADAIPAIEPYSKRGNNPYVVFGKRYVPMTDERAYKVRGHGSWYGKKFHGQKTSSGELYDMYKMTAAHPTLPIPSYARVTNVINGKQVIVRVNDRGPFKSGRVIDLSYTAALKLGYIGHGSAELEVERLLPDDIRAMQMSRESREAQVARPDVPPEQVNAGMDTLIPVVQTNALPPQQSAQPTAPAPVQTPTVASGGPAAPLPAPGYYLQFGAYSQQANAEAVRMRLSQTVGNRLPTLYIEPLNNLYRLYSGPFATRDDASALAGQVEHASGIKPFIVQR